MKERVTWQPRHIWSQGYMRVGSVGSLVFTNGELFSQAEQKRTWIEARRCTTVS